MGGQGLDRQGPGPLYDETEHVALREKAVLKEHMTGIRICLTRRQKRKVRCKRTQSRSSHNGQEDFFPVSEAIRWQSRTSKIYLLF